MAQRNTSGLPASNDFKQASNALQALDLIGNKLGRVSRIAELTAQNDTPEALCEAILTQVRNQLNEWLTELDVWRAL